MEKVVLINLLERGDWLLHEVPSEEAKAIVLDAVNQLDESFGWLCRRLTLHQLDELAECVKAEMRERERARNQSHSEKVGLLGEL